MPINTIKLILTRTVYAGVQKGSQTADSITVRDEEIAHAIYNDGIPDLQSSEFNLQVCTPMEIVEKHMFNTTDHSTKYGSILAASYEGSMIKIAYNYELRIWHQGQDSFTSMQIPVIVNTKETIDPQP